MRQFGSEATLTNLHDLAWQAGKSMVFCNEKNKMVIEPCKLAIVYCQVKLLEAKAVVVTQERPDDQKTWKNTGSMWIFRYHDLDQKKD